MRFLRKFTAALAVALAMPAVTAGQGATTEFIVFSGGKQIGVEQVTIGTSGSDRIISSTGRHAPPIDITITNFQARYSSDWQPIELAIDATFGKRNVSL